jgi:hypothetical protein
MFTLFSENIKALFQNYRVSHHLVSLCGGALPWRSGDSDALSTIVRIELISNNGLELGANDFH